MDVRKMRAAVILTLISSMCLAQPTSAPAPASAPPAASAPAGDESGPVPLAEREAILFGKKAKAGGPDLVDQIKNPVPWFKWGYDERLRWELIDNAFTFDKSDPNHTWDYLRYRSRAWGTVTPAPGLDFNLRMTWEGRRYWDPPSKPQFENKDVAWDNLNIKLKVPDLPVVATVGRQDIMLGDGWLVGDGTPLDGSRTMYYDAVRTTIDLKPAQTTLDLIWLYQNSRSDTWLEPIASKHGNLTEQDEQGVILWAANKSIKNTEIDGYFIYKGNHKVLANGDNGQIYTFGGRGVHEFTKHWVGRGEGGIQFGEKNDRPLCAQGYLGRLSYLFLDPWKNQLKLNTEYLSGDGGPHQGRDTGWDPLWGRWPQFGDLSLYTWTSETRIGQATNMYRLGLGWQMDPTDKLSILGDWNYLWAQKNPLKDKAGWSSYGKVRGNLFQALVKYKINRFVSGHLFGECLLPGSYHESPKDDVVLFLRSELVFTF